MASYSQAERHLRLKTTLGEDKFLIERLSGTESISAPFLFTLDVLSEDPSVSPDDLLRQPVGIAIDAPGSERMLHGHVRRFVQQGRSKGLTRYHMEVVPRLWFLSLSRDCRIYQEMSVPDIVSAVFGEMEVPDFQIRCTGSYPPREYCVQYRETHLEFVSRLLEEEGIFYFFEHGEDGHTLVLADAPSAIEPCPGQATAKIADDSGTWREEDVVTSLVLERSARTGKVVLTDYNPLTPALNLQVEIGDAGKSEQFDYPGEYEANADGDRYARLRLEELEAEAEVVHGDSTCRHFRPGSRVELQGHYRRDANKPYLLVRVHHEAGSGGYRAEMADSFDYRNSFTAIPYATPYRPARTTPRPIIHGSQTAVVTGPSGEEIYVDKYGRVKVQFHWDRKGKEDDKSSCWVRVSSTWAGKAWGFIQIPRIGQEVVVNFLEGNPDAPLITGRVYNADQMPPYALPANQTQSGLKTRSSKDGSTEDFNELRFEDLAGSEQVYLHAQKDWDTVVENDRTLDVGNDETITVKHDRAKTVDGDETVTVKGNRTEKVSKDESITIEGKRTETVSKDESITIQGKREESVGQKESVTIGQSREHTVGQEDKVTVGASRKATIAQNDETSAGQAVTIKAGQSITLQAGMEITLQAGPCSIKLGPSGIEVTGVPNVVIKAAAQVQIQGAAQVDVQGAMVGITGGLVKIN